MHPEMKAADVVSTEQLLPHHNKMAPSASSSRDALFAQYSKIIFAVSIYWFFSITLVFLNKYLLSSDDLKLDAPLFVTWSQCIVTLILLLALSVVAQRVPHIIAFPPFHVDRKILISFLPLSVVFVGMIAFNNLCLKYVGVSFYYIGRSLSTVFNVICTYVILGEKTSCRALVCCGIILSGYALGVDQEDVAGSLSISGVVYGVLASLCVALNAIYTKKMLHMVNGNIWHLNLYNNINAVLIFIPLIIFSNEIRMLRLFEHFNDAKFWILLAASGIFGFAMGYVTGLQIEVTSALTHNVSGTAKAAAQTVIAVAYYGEFKPLLWWLSNSVVLIGSGAYTWVKQQEMKLKYQQKQQEHNEPNGRRSSKSGEAAKSINIGFGSDDDDGK